MAAPPTYSSVVGFFYNLNLIVGSGFLGIPFVLSRSGLLAGVLTLLVVAFFSGLTARWILETMYRGQLVLRRSDDHNISSDPQSNDGQLPPKLEVGQLCGMFAGTWARFAYDISNFVYASLALWAYGTLAGSAWATNIPFDTSTLGQCTDADFRGHQHPATNECWNSYALCVLLFGFVVVPLSCVEINEQKIVQLVLGVVRLLMIVSMSIYALVGEIEHPDCVQTAAPTTKTTVGTDHTNHTHNATVNECEDVWLSFHLRGWILVFPIITYALFLHLGIPTLTHPIKDKKNVGTMMTSLFLACTFLYLLIGISVAVRYKENVVETCTLTWAPFTKSGSFIKRFYAYLVVLYPSLDICSAYPLMVTILSNIFITDYELLTKNVSTKSMRVVSRFLIATTPLIGSLFISNLVQVTTYTGVFGCISCYLFPALIQYRSRRFIQNLGHINESEIPRSSDEEDTLLFRKDTRPVGDKDTPYTTIFSGDVMVFVVAVFGVWATGTTIASWVDK